MTIAGNMTTVIIKDKTTNSYIGEIDIFNDELSNIEKEFVVIKVGRSV